MPTALARAMATIMAAARSPPISAKSRSILTSSSMTLSASKCCSGPRARSTAPERSAAPSATSRRSRTLRATRLKCAPRFTSIRKLTIFPMTPAPPSTRRSPRILQSAARSISRMIRVSSTIPSWCARSVSPIRTRTFPIPPMSRQTCAASPMPTARRRSRPALPRAGSLCRGSTRRSPIICSSPILAAGAAPAPARPFRPGIMNSPSASKSQTRSPTSSWRSKSLPISALPS